MDGVLYRGDQALPGAADFVSWLRGKGIAFSLVTNNATLTPAQYVARLDGIGIAAREDEIFTSALATALYLKERAGAGATAYAIGEEGLRAALELVDIKLSGDRPDWVIVGLDRHVTYEKLATAALAIQRGAQFIGTNPDTSLPTERGLAPGAGAIQAALSATTGVKPTVVGKPEPLMLELALKQMNAAAETAALLGDRLDTDIQGAHAVGLPSILVLTGVSTRQEATTGPIRPTLIVDDLPSLMREWGK